MKIIDRGLQRKGPAHTEHAILRVGKKPEPEAKPAEPAKPSALPVRTAPTMTKVATTLLGGKT